jgi:glycosyltransferase involved in cell wall biosynthesis
MRIVVISTAQVPSSNANSIQALKVCQALRQLGHEVLCLVGGSQSSAWEALAEPYGLSTRFEIEWIAWNPFWKRYDFAWKSVRRAVEWKADLLYTWAAHAAAFGLLCGLCVLLEVHDLPVGVLGPLWLRAFLRLPGKKVFAPITQALRLALEERYPPALSPGQVVVLPSGVDIERYADLPEPPAARAHLGLPEQLTVGCAGHLYSGRGAELFLALAVQHPRVRFLWVGGRPEDVEYYRAQAAERGLGNVTFTGFISNARLALYQAACEILLMPYERRIAVAGGGDTSAYCSPMKLFEYLAAGRAILSSDLPVFHEVLYAGNAVFAPPEDVQAWGEVLDTLIQDPTYRSTLARQAALDSVRYALLERERRALQPFGFGG